MSKVSDVHNTLLSTSVKSVDTNVALTPVAAGKIPQNVLNGLDKAGDAFRTHTLPTNLSPGFVGQIDWNHFGKVIEVSQLDKAEALAQDAFKKVSDPNANFVDKLQAQEEMQQAAQIRQSVEKNLTPLQRQAVNHINQEEQNAVKTETTAGGGLLGGIEKAIAQAQMGEAAGEEKSLDKWILS